MKTAPLPIIIPSASIAAGTGMLALLGVFWLILLMLTTGRPDPAATGGLGALQACACAVMAIIAAHRTKVLADARRVFSLQRAPDALWRAWARCTLSSLTRYWAVLCIGMVAQLLMPASTTFWLTGPALLSPVLCLTVQRMLARHGLAARGWAWGIDIATSGLALYAAFGPGVGASVQWFSALPAPLLLAFALSWPATAWLLLRRWQGPLPAYRAAEHKPATLAPGGVFSFFKRYSVLRWDDAATTPLGPMGNKPLALLTQLFSGELLFYLVVLKLLPTQWGDTATPLRALGLFIICTVTASKLVVRDLHWRSLLLPGGMRHSRIGAHILLSTLTVQILVLLLICLGYAAFSLAIGTAPGVVLAQLGGALILPFELAFVSSGAVALRASSTRQFMGVIGVVTLIAGIAGLVLEARLPDAGTWTIGPGYLMLLLAGTALLRHAANRMWTVEKLFRELH